ncbi:ATPase domain-containing protein [Thalassorhabdus alkalitolerans]|uniref:ATPase domain-containing protein n=1 Tax=Thalassorhabdus alkalitolerans TaxID=2282697 RepID=A0ABW0YH21_9BACI
MAGKCATGIQGLDEIIEGGLPEKSAVILEGAPGTGKTTIGIQFLLHGIQQNEPGIYITFEEFPEQLYEDMKSYGWDLRKHEINNNLRVVCLSPEVLMEQLTTPKGLLEVMVQEIGCKRIVIDSISLFRYLSQEGERDNRKILYTLRNTLRRLGLTSLLIQEQSSLQREDIPFEHFLVDGVIRLYLKEHMSMFRKRTLEVVKMRGARLFEGEHVYRITEEGIYVMLAAQTVVDKQIDSRDKSVNTGIESLDRLLGGGMAEGAVYMLDTNSKANYRHIIASILGARLKEGYSLISLLSSTQTITEFGPLLKLHNVDIEKAIKDQRVYFIEHYDRPVPSDWEHAVFQVKDLSNEEYSHFIDHELINQIKNGPQNSASWFVYYDLNTIFNERGKDYVLRSFAKEAALCRSLGLTMLVLCNFKEVGEQAASFLERTTNGVFKTWVDGAYQYLQVTKSPNGLISEPCLLESKKEHPFIRLR